METLIKEIEGHTEYRVTSDGVIYGKYGKRLKQVIKKNRPEVGIYDETKKQIRLSVSRAVATAFCDVPYHLKDVDKSELQVHHIDGNPQNNVYTNLLWVTKDEHAKIHEYSYSMTIAQIKGNTIVHFYPSINKASEKTGIPIQNISSCIKNRRITAGGYKWANKLEGEYKLSLQ